MPHLRVEISCTNSGYGLIISEDTSSINVVQDSNFFIEHDYAGNKYVLSTSINDSGMWYIDFTSMRISNGSLVPIDYSEVIGSVLVEVGGGNSYDDKAIPFYNKAPARNIILSNKLSSNDQSLVSRASAASGWEEYCHG